MAKNNNLKDFVTGVAGAIREKKGTTELINPQDFESEIRTIQTGVDTSDATATADDIRLGKTAYGVDGKMTGTIADYDGSSEPASGKSLFAELVNRTITAVLASDLAGIRNLGNYAFSWCYRLTSITVPNSVINIGDHAFDNCSKLASITIPDSVTDIGDNAFEYCSSLTSITIPNNVTKINNSLFRYCRSLTSIIIGNSVTRIGYSVFNYCSENTELGGTYTILAVTPPTIQSSTFGNAKINKIIVPKGTLDTYKSATNWSAYADKMAEASE